MRKKKMPNFLSVIRTKIPRHFTQVLATLAVSLGPFAAGLGKGYTSPALASLTESKASTFPVSPQEASWIASLSLLGAIFGCLTGGILLQFGRKMSLLLVALPFSASWLLTVFAVGVEMMYCSSFLAGFCSAAILLATQVYVSEISHPEIRGCLSAILKMAGQLGALCSTSLGAFLDWRELAGAAAVVPILFFLAILAIPETPSFLLYHSREEEATKSLSWLRSSQEDVPSEIETLRSNILTKEKSLIPKFTSQLTRPLCITCGLMFFHKFSGITVFNYYAVPIFKHVYNSSSVLSLNFTAQAEDSMSMMTPESFILPEHESVPEGITVFGKSLNPHGLAIVVIFLQLLGSMTSGLLIDTAGRLPLLIISSLFISGSFFGFGLYNWLEVSLPIKQSGFGPSLDWIPLTCVLFFTLFFSIGIGPISWLLVGELFPLEFRGFGGAICTSFSYACAFVAVKTYEDIKSEIGLYGAFWIYSGISIAGLFFVCYAVPETKGVELEEMHHTETTLSHGGLAPVQPQPQPPDNSNPPPPIPSPRPILKERIKEVSTPPTLNNNHHQYKSLSARNQLNRISLPPTEPAPRSILKDYQLVSSRPYLDINEYYPEYHHDTTQDVDPSFPYRNILSQPAHHPMPNSYHNNYHNPFAHLNEFIPYMSHPQRHKNRYHSQPPQYQNTYHTYVHAPHNEMNNYSGLFYQPQRRQLKGTSV